jgi:cytochrome c biogenesis protein CcdA
MLTDSLKGLKKVELEARCVELQERLADASKPTTASAKFKVGMTLALGCGIPVLSLALSMIAGTLANRVPLLALFAFGLMIAVLMVSLPHLRWAISDITKSERLASWCLAVALDLSLVLCELTHVYADDCGLGLVVNCVMLAVCLASMALNCWAFFKAPHAK